MLNAYGHLIVTLLSFGIAALFATIFLIELLALDDGLRLGARRIALTSLLLAMWAGGMAVTADLSSAPHGRNPRHHQTIGMDCSGVF